MKVDSGDSCRLLLIEDNPADADLIREYLEELADMRFKVIHAPSLRAGTRILESTDISIILLDLRLPDASGVESVKATKASFEAIPIVVLTGMEDETLAISCLEAGAQDYISKGEIAPRALARSIRYAITRQREAEERRRLECQLEDALARILGGFVPICSHCKNIREGEFWSRVEDYVERHSNASFGHTICPDCLREHGLGTAGKTDRG